MTGASWLPWLIAWLVVSLVLVSAFLLSFTYWPVTRRTRARLSRAELVHYVPQRYLASTGDLVRLAPSPGRKWLYLYEGRTLPWFGAIVNHTGGSKNARHPYACVAFNGADIANSDWTDKVLRRPLDGALKVPVPIETRAVVTANVVPSTHRRSRHRA